MATNFSCERSIETFYDTDRIVLSSDGKYLFCACGPNVNIVCVDDGSVKEKIVPSDGGEDAVIKFTVTSDDRMLIIAYNSQLIRKYPLSLDYDNEKNNFTEDKIFKSIHKHRITYLKCNKSSTLLATGSSDSTVKIWNLLNHYCTHNLRGINGVISCIEFYEDLENGICQVYCAGGDDTVHVFDLTCAGGSRICKLKAHSSTITSIQILPYNEKNSTQLIITSGRDKIAVLWELTYEISKIKDGNNSKDKSSMAIQGMEMKDIKRTTGAKVAIKRTIPLFESVESMLLLNYDYVVEEIFSEKIADTNAEQKESIFFATVGELGIICLWDAVTGAKILQQPKHDAPQILCLQLCLREKSKDKGRIQFVVVSFERTIYFYQLAKQHFHLLQQLQGNIGEVLSCCWLGSNESHLALATNTQTIGVFELSSSRYQQFQGHTEIVVCVRSFPTHPLVMLSSSKDCTVLIWLFRRLKPTIIDDSEVTPNLGLDAEILYRVTGHTQSVTSVIPFNLSTNFVTASEDTTIKLWSFNFDLNGKEPSKILATVKSLTTIKAHEMSIDALAIAPNDEFVATGSRDKIAKIFMVNKEKLKHVSNLKGHRRGIWALQFSPSDQLVATASGDATIKLWNLHDQCCLMTLQGHDCSVLNLQFLTNGMQILSVSSDGNMKLWDCKTNECIKTIDAHQGRIWCLLLSQTTTKLLVTGGDDATIKLWKDTTEEENRMARARLQSLSLNEQNFHNYTNKKLWHKALKLAIVMENSGKTQSVLREILLSEPNSLELLQNELIKLRPDQLEFIVKCVATWNCNTKNSHLAQCVLNCLFYICDHDSIKWQWGSSHDLNDGTSLLDQLIFSTQKHYNRYCRLVQQATFVDFIHSSFKFSELPEVRNGENDKEDEMDLDDETNLLEVA